MAETRQFVVTVNTDHTRDDWQKAIEEAVSEAIRRVAPVVGGDAASAVQVVEVPAKGARVAAVPGVDPKALADARAAVARLKSGHGHILNDTEERAHLRTRRASSRRIASILQKSRSR
jgi:hypothetical protein